jgi:succinate dehydrogenase / fumarate reductase cytochrome b subunit
MHRLLTFFRSSIGLKVVMAMTGLALFGFVIAHMVGNLQVYLGPTRLDEYGASLRRLPALLWGLRIGLLAAVLLHIVAAWSLTRMSLTARPSGYARRENVASTYASRLMRWSGVTLFLFIVYHLLHFTIGSVHPHFVEGGVNHNFVTGFQVPAVSAFYILAMLALGLHLYHGTWSLLRTLGFSHPRYDATCRAIATTLTLLVVGGNISFPLAVLAGIVREAPDTARPALAGSSPPR